ncbi:DNA internalization-related competence protein ComEC/Rec2 [Leucothrix sargassi]|nr:DNA internalization-related competence protein ComEC/Rec2 [Leucothrix sargassi]
MPRALILLLGAMLLTQLTILPNLLLCEIILTVAVIFSLYLRSYQRKAVSTVMLLMIGFCYAATVANLRLDNKFPSFVEGKDLLVSGKVASLVRQRDYGEVFLFDIHTAKLAETGESLPWAGQVRLNSYRNDFTVQAGESWQLQVRMKRPNGFMNPSGFDYEKWLFAEGIEASGYIRTSTDNRKLANAPWYSVNALRASIDSKIRALMRGEALAIGRALVLAEKDKMSTQQWEVLIATGTSHLMAISGLHIGLVAGSGFLIVWALYWLFPSLALSLPRQLAGCLLGVVLATFYAMLAGFTIPTQRALIMVVVALLALMSRWHYQAIRILALALILVLLVNPLATLSVGFYLSFSAVALILWLLLRRMQEVRFKLVYLQLCLSLVMVPIGLLFFGEGSLVSPLANLIAIPWVSFVVVPFSFLAVVLSYVSESLATLVFDFVTLNLQALFALLTWLADWPKASITMQHTPTYLGLIAVVGACLIVLPRGLSWRYLAVLLLLPFCLYQVKRSGEGDFRLTVLDVGQGLATVIETKRHTLVFDAGDKPSESFDLGKLVVTPYLQYRDIETVDRFVISHADRDHIGGAAAVLSAFDVKELVSSHKLEDYDVPTTLCRSGQSWSWDGVEFMFLHPSNKLSSNKNNHSCVLKVSSEKWSVLLTGDIERAAEKQLVKHHSEQLVADVLLMPHHGSQSSSTQAFIERVNPTYAVASAGYRSRFKHPSSNVIKRYQAIDSKVLKTANTGAITFDFVTSETEAKVTHHRQARQGFWSREIVDVVTNNLQ